MKGPIKALSAVALLSSTASAFPNPFSSIGSSQQQLRFGLPSHHEPDALERVIDAMQGAVKLAEQKGGKWKDEVMAEADRLVDEMERLGARLGVAMTGLGRPDKEPVPTGQIVEGGAHVEVDGVSCPYRCL